MPEAHPSRGPIRFSVFEVDVQAGELRKQGVRVKLQAQPFHILQVLLEHPGEVITREELQKQIWPSDTFVDFDHGLNNAMKRLREALGDTAETPHFIETIPRRGYRFIGNLAQGQRRIESLAVLPLENFSRDPDQDYFAEGMTEALITMLAKVGALRVVSRTTAMQYQGVRRPLREIAREMQVDAIVEGSVQRSGDRVRIFTQLIDAHADVHLWAESYDRDLRDVLTLQAELAQAIAEKVQVKLTPHERSQLESARPVDPEAYEAYLKGRYHWNRRSGNEFGRAVQYFQQAISKDPTYAVSYAGLADCLSVLGLWSLVPPEDGCGRAKNLALKALELNHGLAEGHVSLAWATLFYDYDFKAAEREFERAIELNPRLPQAHQWFGYLLALLGRPEEAYTEVQRALRLDPCSAIIHWTLGYVYWRARRYDQAIEQHEKALELDPHSAQWHWGLGVTCVDNRQNERAISALQTANELSPGVPMIFGYLGVAYAAAGRLAAAEKILEELDEQSTSRHITPYIVGRIYAAMGKKDEALRCLEAGYRARTGWMVQLRTEAGFDDYRSDPCFQDLQRRIDPSA